ncbi:MAG TPA: ABC transporter substrate-binding protein [Chloroflexota bacterium]|nr:ABC transporter substrate-binding protein [Chloroflexota bacterium]
MPFIYRLLTRALGLAVLLALAGCGSGAGRPPPQEPASVQGAAPAADSRLQPLVDGARREGALSLIWGEGTMGGSDGIRRLAEGFNRQYGLNLDVKFTPGPSMPSVAARIAEEYQAGRPSATDVQVGYANHIMAAMHADAIEPVDWASWAPNVQRPELIAGGGAAVAYQSSWPGIAYNTQRVRADEVPRTLQDLLKPQYKGRIASTPYAASFDQVAAPEVWGEERTFAYVRQLADQIAGLIRCNEMQRLTSGEFDLLALACSHNGAMVEKAKGGPLDFVIPADAPLLVPLYAAVPKNAAHPNAAKLWVNYVMGREAQDLLYELDGADNHEVPGSKTAQDFERFLNAGLKFTRIDIAFYENNDERLGPVRDELQRILAKQ